MCTKEKTNTIYTWPWHHLLLAVHVGICRHTEDTYECECPRHFRGAHCEHEVHSCKSAPCKNGAECIDVGIGSFECICREGMLCSAFSWLDKVCIEASCTDLCYWELYICAIAEVVLSRCPIESNCQDLHEYDWVINRYNPTLYLSPHCWIVCGWS